MRQKNNAVTVYNRGTFKIEGSTAEDRECMRLDNKRYWTYKIIFGIVALIAALTSFLKAIYPFFK